MTVLLILLCLFIVTWFAPLPPPFFIVLCILEAIALVIWFTPFGPVRSLGW